MPTEHCCKTSLSSWNMDLGVFCMTERVEETHDRHNNESESGNFTILRPGASITWISLPATVSALCRIRPTLLLERQHRWVLLARVSLTLSAAEVATIRWRITQKSVSKYEFWRQGWLLQQITFLNFDVRKTVRSDRIHDNWQSFIFMFCTQHVRGLM